MEERPVFSDPLDRGIYWLASYPKSGNTWVRMFLNAYASGFPVDGHMNSPFQFVHGDIYPAMMQVLSCRPVGILSNAEQFMIRPAQLLAMINLHPSRSICLKTHNAKVNVEQIPVIPSVLSNKAIYIVRDPRDVCVSLADHFGQTLDEAITFMCNQKQGHAQMGTNLVHILSTWSIHIGSWTINNKDVETLVIKYEDMLEDPELYFTDMLRHFNIPLDQDKFSFALQQSSFENLRRIEDEDGFRELSKNSKSGKFFRVGKANQWFDVLSREQIQRIENDHYEVMERFDYQLAGSRLVTNV